MADKNQKLIKSKRILIAKLLDEAKRANPNRIEKIVSKLIKLLNHTEIRIACDAAKAVADINNQTAIDQLIAMMLDNNAKLQLRETIIGLLVTSKHDKILDAYIQLMDSDRDTLSAKACVYTAVLAKAKAAPLLLEKIISTDSRLVSIHAAMGLKAIKDADSITKAVAVLIERIKNEDGYNRKKAIYTAGYLEDKRAIEPIEKVLEDRDNDQNMRDAAALSLGRMKETSAVAYLVGRLYDRNIRREAIEMLVHIDHYRAFDALQKELMMIGNDAIAECIVEALADSGKKQAADALLYNLRVNLEDDSLFKSNKDKIPIIYYGLKVMDIEAYLKKNELGEYVRTPLYQLKTSGGNAGTMFPAFKKIDDYFKEQYGKEAYYATASFR